MPAGLPPNGSICLYRVPSARLLQPILLELVYTALPPAAVTLK